MDHYNISRNIDQDRERFGQLFFDARDLWNQFDPIGVFDMVEDERDVLGEYENYIGQTIAFLQRPIDHEPDKYVRYVVYEYMCLSKNKHMEDAISKFIVNLRDWHANKGS